MSGTGAWQESLMYWQLTQFSVYLLYILHGGLSAVPQKAQVFTDFPTVYARANVQNVDTVLNFQWCTVPSRKSVHVRFAVVTLIFVDWHSCLDWYVLPTSMQRWGHKVLESTLMGNYVNSFKRATHLESVEISKMMLPSIMPILALKKNLVPYKLHWNVPNLLFMCTYFS